MILYPSPIPSVTAEMMNIIPLPRPAPKQPNFMEDIMGFLPPLELVQALGTFLPRLKRENMVTDDLVPQGSSLRPIFDNIKEDEYIKQSKETGIRITQSEINSPIGMIQIKSMSTII